MLDDEGFRKREGAVAARAVVVLATASCQNNSRGHVAHDVAQQAGQAFRPAAFLAELQ